MKKISLLLLALICSVATWAKTEVTNENISTQLVDGVYITLQCMDTNGGDGYYFNGAATKSSSLKYANFFKVVSNGSDAFYLQRVSDSKYVANSSNAVAMVDATTDAAAFTFSVATATNWTTTGTAANNGVNSVRFTTSSTYLNCQGSTATPKYATGTGGYSIWEVFTYTEDEVEAYNVITLFSKPAFGGTEWTWNTETNVFDADGQTSTATPGRLNNMGAHVIFNNVGTVSASSSADTSDKGGVTVSGNSTVTTSLGNWAGSILVEDYAIANVTLPYQFKNTEATDAANVWTNGTLNISGTLNFNDGNTYQNWYIGENGTINTSISSVTSNRTWTIQVVVADEAEQGGVARTTTTLKKKVMTWGANLSSSISSIEAYYKDADGKLTKLSSDAVSYDATGITVTYEGLGYESVTYTFNYVDASNSSVLKTETVDQYASLEKPSVPTKAWFGWSQGTESYDEETRTYTVPMTNTIGTKKYALYALDSNSNKCYVKAETAYNDDKANNALMVAADADHSVFTFEPAAVKNDKGTWKLKNTAKDQYFVAGMWNNGLSDDSQDWVVYSQDDKLHLFNTNSGGGYVGLNSTTLDVTSESSDNYIIYCDKSVEKFETTDPDGTNSTKSGLTFYLEEVTTADVTYVTSDNKWTKKYTVALGAAYPTPEANYMIVFSGVPEGTVTGDETVTLTYTTRYDIAADVESVSKWYSIDIHGNQANYPLYVSDGYVMNPYNGSYGVDASVYQGGCVDSKYAWAFIGDAFTGIKLYNKTSGLYATQANDADEKITATASGTVFQICKTASSVANSFALKAEGRSYYFNHRSEYIQGWTSADEGSSLRAFEITPVEETTANMNIQEKLGCATFVAPFAVTIPDGVKAYTTEYAETWVKLNEIEDGVIPAATPVVVYGSEGIYTEGAYVYEPKGLPTTVAETANNGVLTGNISSAKKEIPTGNVYILQNQTENGTGWYQVTATGLYIGVNRCYMINAAPNARAFYGMSFGDATGINDIATEAQAKADGKYLVNGKIVVVKAGKAYNIGGQEVK